MIILSIMIKLNKTKMWNQNLSCIPQSHPSSYLFMVEILLTLQSKILIHPLFLSIL